MSSELYSKKIICPVCSNEFETKKVKTSAIRITKRDEDMCPYYGKQNPIFYQICVCPNCGYANFESKYNSINRLHKEKLEALQSFWKYRDLGGERDIDIALDTYKLALLNLDRMQISKLDVGKVCLRIAWIYRYKKNEDEEIRFIDYTLNNFETAYTKEKIDEEEELIVLFMLGELCRRRKRFKDAIKWFDMVVRHRDIKRKRHIELRARDQWQKCREEYNAQKQIG